LYVWSAATPALPGKQPASVAKPAGVGEGSPTVGLTPANGTVQGRSSVVEQRPFNSNRSNCPRTTTHANICHFNEIRKIRDAQLSLIPPRFVKPSDTRSATRIFNFCKLPTCNWTASQIWTECSWNREDWLCEACAVAHACGEEMCLR
jgi:hypothetical protein